MLMKMESTQIYLALNSKARKSFLKEIQKVKIDYINSVVLFYFLTSKLVLSMMDKRGLITSTSQYSHRYPHDWRTRGPVFLRATPQWFANVSNLMTIAEVCNLSP